MSNTCKLSGQHAWVLVLALPFIFIQGLGFLSDLAKHNVTLISLECFGVKSVNTHKHLNSDVWCTEIVQ
jgi:hypothetical protein